MAFPNNLAVFSYVTGQRVSSSCDIHSAITIPVTSPTHAHAHAHANESLSGDPGADAPHTGCLLHEGHRENVPVFVAGQDHPVPGHALSYRTKQGDDQRWSVLDHHQYRYFEI